MVEVKMESTDTEVTVTVIDQGIGVPKDSIPKLFTKYFRAKGGLTTNSQGTGIGLFIAKTIIDTHGGEIGVRSEEGKGSEFYFTLKRVKIDGEDKAKGLRSNIDWF